MPTRRPLPTAADEKERRPQKSTTRAGRSGFCSRKSSPARFPASPFRKSSRRLFSFNNPYGACPACGGLGIEQHIDEDLVIPDKELTLRKGAIAPWAKSSSPYYVQTLTALGKFYKFTLDTKWKDLPKKTQRRDPARLRRGRDQVLLRRRRALLRHQEAVRGRHHQHQPPLSRDRKRMGARGTGEVFLRRSLRGLPRLSAEAGSALRQDRRQAYRRHLRDVGAPRRRMVRDRAEGAQRAAERDRRPGVEGDPRAAVVPARY